MHKHTHGVGKMSVLLLTVLHLVLPNNVRYNTAALTLKKKKKKDFAVWMFC